VRVIAGSAGGRPLRGPAGRGTRPTADRVKEALFSMLAGVVAGADVLDLYAGTGALGIEALSRGAASALFVDRDPACARLIRRNLQATGLEAAAEVWVLEAAAACRRLARSGRRFDLILADPPYRGQEAGWAIAAAGPLCAAGATVVVEHDAREELPAVAGNLVRTRDRSYGDTRLGIYRAEG
jgi:16S rRNA (guanine966-N2)-methyltransferase